MIYALRNRIYQPNSKRFQLPRVTPKIDRLLRMAFSGAFRRPIQSAFAGADSAAFSPLNISSLVSLYDFSDITTQFQDEARTTPVTTNGQTIAGMQDKSGNGNHLVMSVSADRPVYTTAQQNSLSTARFNSRHLERAGLTLAQPFTVFAVAKMVTTSGALTVVGTSASFNRVGMNKSGNARGYIYGGNELYSTADTPLSQYCVRAFVMNGASSAHYLNGSADGTGNANTGSLNGATFYVGANYNTTTEAVDGYFGEIFFYSRVLSAAEIALCFAGLNAKWAIY